ncbi:MAG: hypothetical protein KDI47_05185 [Gammaproteobacteria bacterium]|nr:hypothetical protein [Gammaproteobacteria bacterium]MCP5407889.1 hypothetical protein [Chromatiaceae bacterium]
MANRSTQRKQVRKSSISMRCPWALSLAVAGLLTSFGAGAADYSQYTTEELVQMRTQARDMSEQDRDNYRAEMSARTQNMSPEERANLGLGRDRSRFDAAADTDVRQRVRNNEDNKRGRGELVRERSRAEAGSSDYGYGYEQRQSQGGRSGGMGQRGGGGRGR